jgi:PPOX class probable F420-dependent enzyme
MERLDPERRHRVISARSARLATVRPDGRPHIVPITFALLDDVLVTAVDHKPKSTTALQRLRNIAANPAASVLVDEYRDDWSALWWVRADGAARVADAGRDHDRAITTLVEKYPQYREHPPEGPAIIIAVDRWVSWSAL